MSLSTVLHSVKLPPNYISTYLSSMSHLKVNLIMTISKTIIFILRISYFFIFILHYYIYICFGFIISHSWVTHFSFPLEILNILILKPLLMFFSYFHLICHEFISCCQVVAWLKVAWLQGSLLLCGSIRGSVISTVSPQSSKSGIFFSSFSVSRSSTVRPALAPHCTQGTTFPSAPRNLPFLASSLRS